MRDLPLARFADLRDGGNLPPDNRNLRRALWLMIWLTPVVAVGLPWVLP